VSIDEVPMHVPPLERLAAALTATPSLAVLVVLAAAALVALL
jgi:hypothetical protein